MKITWNTNVNAPCCPGEIVAEDGRTLLIQTDWDYPGVASSFGWSIRNVQHCPACRSTETQPDAGESAYECRNCDECRILTFTPCPHSHTDGTVDCPECGVTVAEFLTAAREWLDDHDGAEADDPGYFDEGGE